MSSASEPLNADAPPPYRICKLLSDTPEFLPITIDDALKNHEFVY